MSFVLDASVVVAWLLDDEDDPVARAVLERLASEAALVPQAWHVEVRSALLGAERRGRLQPAQADDCLGRARELPVQTDSSPDLDRAFALARARRLSVYDALYLELALRTGTPLATLDRALTGAARAESVGLVRGSTSPDSA
ncbi:MAG: type II toxin-antitoxin system VapC family toxin [Gammaproteobacteria bacterium]|nr:type II toxin-antitoxin system VapC family toxin [Gammaproteobacteria bacterium]